MTISTRIETALSAREHGFQYVRSSNIAVISITGERSEPSTSLRIVLEACGAKFEQILRRWLSSVPDAKLFLFIATPFWEQHNAVSRRRGIWRSEDLNWLPGHLPRSTSIELTGGDGTRFAGLTELRADDIFEAADFVRTHSSNFLFVSHHRELTEERVRAIATKVFPDGEITVNWGSAVEQVEEGEDICVRVSGGFDDREASIDAFLAVDLLQRLGQP